MTHPDADAVADRAGPSSSVLLSAEHADVGIEWIVSGRVRLRRQVVTETHSVEVTLRREELIVETMDVESAQDDPSVWRGTDLEGGAVAAPTGSPSYTMVLRREVPDISTHVEAYELVRPLFRWQTEHVPVPVTVQREHAALDDTNAVGDGTSPGR